LLVEKEEGVTISLQFCSEIGNGEYVATEEESIADKSCSALVAVCKGLDIGENTNSNESLFDGVGGVVDRLDGFV
jgi:hypothetical protein